MRLLRGTASGFLFPAIVLAPCLFSTPFSLAEQTSSPRAGSPAITKPAAARFTVGRYGRENWDSLAIGDSKMHMDDPLLGERDEEADFTRELFRVQWREGDPIDLYVIRPAHLARPPVVLYLYSYPSDTRRFLDDSYCRRVTKDGFAAVGFISALTGARYHNRAMKQWFVSELQESMVLSVHDVQMILNYLGTRGDLNTSSIGMFGAGSGGSIAILAAAVDRRIKTLDLLDPWGDWPDWMAGSSIVPEQERPDFAKPDFLERVAPLDPVRWLPRLKQTIRLQHVMDDRVTPLAAKKQLEAAAPHSLQLVRYGDSPQLFKAAAGGALFDWIKQQLRSTASAGAVRSI